MKAFLRYRIAWIVGFCCFGCFARCAFAVVIPVESASQLNNAIAGARPGDIVVLKNGTYDGASVKFNAKGSADRPITLQAESPGRVIFSGQHTYFEIKGSHLILSGFQFLDIDTTESPFQRLMVLSEADHCRVTDCLFVRVGRRTADAHIIDVWNNSHHNRIDHCRFEEIYGIGIEVRVATSGFLGGTEPDLGNVDNAFDHLHFQNIPKYSQKEAIQVGRGSSGYGVEFATPSRTIIEWCLFEQVDGDNELISIKSSNNVIRYNVVRNCNAAIKLRGGKDNRVEGNWIEYKIPHQQNEVGIAVYGTGHIVLNNYIFGTIHGVQLYTGNGGTEPDVADVLIAHNTIVGVSTIGVQLGHKEGAQPRNCRILNNIVQMNSLGCCPPKCFSERPGATGIVYSGNIAWPVGGKTVAGLEGPGIRVANPLFETSEAPWRLSPGSAALAGARLVPAVSDDIDGQARGEVPHIGCDQHSNAPVVRYPVTAKQVGPLWHTDARSGT